MDIIKLVFMFCFLAITRTVLSYSKHGSELARQLIPRDWAFSLFIALLFSIHWPRSLIPAFIFLLFTGITRLAHVIKESDGSQVLLRWKLNRQLASFIIILLAITGFFVALSFIFHQPIQIEDLLWIGLLFILVIAVVSVEKEMCLTENGVETGSDYIRWEQIKSYRWSNSANKVTHLFFQTTRRFPIFNLVQLNLPVEMKQAVDEIVKQKVPPVVVVQEETTQV